MDTASPLPAALPNLIILLMDSSAERRALRQKALLVRGLEVIVAGDLTEASSVWHRDRYDLVLIDIRNNHHGCLAWRDEIKKESPKQIVAFLVGPPTFIDLEPLPGSYVTEEHGTPWGQSMRQAVREACASLPYRNGFVEVGYRIAAARKLAGLPPRRLHTGDLVDVEEAAFDAGRDDE